MKFFIWTKNEIRDIHMNQDVIYPDFIWLNETLFFILGSRMVALPQIRHWRWGGMEIPEWGYPDPVGYPNSI
jgi:hypothetical protein